MAEGIKIHPEAGPFIQKDGTWKMAWPLAEIECNLKESKSLCGITKCESGKYKYDSKGLNF